jgi:hypothetical protein
MRITHQVKPWSRGLEAAPGVVAGNRILYCLQKDASEAGIFLQTMRVF